MDELVKLVATRSGLSQDKARSIVNTVIEYIKDRLPAPLASQIDGLLSSTGTSSAVSGTLGQLGGLLGKK